MKKIYGTIFKELRLNKGYSIKEISDSEVSSATISKFEHGSAMISVDKFFRILSNINVSPSEFSSYVEERLGIPYSFNRIGHYFIPFNYRGKNLVKVKQMLELLKKEYLVYPERKFLKFQIINLKSIISQLSSEYKYTITQKEIQIIRQHLLNTRNWNEFELLLFCGTVYLFDLDTLNKLTRKLLNPFNYRLFSPDIKFLMTASLINLVDSILRLGSPFSQNQIDFIEEIIRYIAEHPIDDKYTFEKGFLKFNIGVYVYLSGNKEGGIKEMKEVIYSFSLLGCDNYAESLIIEFEKITSTPYFKL